ncbi:hypothetical protein CPC08DRAFT_702130 [Agrocybe pediades]|nr:hypothetical protein CPC08DRAFT_702130 [Agrocybe pediades]
MQRPGPLKELPLDRFLPSNSLLTPAPSKPARNNKRPLSPGGASLFSPAKRRILREDGIYSPERTCKPSLSSIMSSPARFSQVLSGPDSPARKLDFGMPKFVAGDPQKRSSSTTFMTRSTAPVTPKQAPIASSSSLAPSPELKTTSARAVRASSPRSMDFSQQEEDVDGDRAENLRSCCCKSCNTQPSTIPRELPPLPNPSSIHYPGFEVYRDPHLLEWATEKDDSCQRRSQVDSDTNQENVPPRRKTRKAPISLAKSDFKDPAITPIPASPGKSRAPEDTPSRSGIAASLSTMSLPSDYTHSPATKSDKYKIGLQQLRDEMDICDDDYPFDD